MERVYKKINNKKITEEERRWLECILAVDVMQKSEIINQINSADINRDYTNFYLSLKFRVEKKAKQVSVTMRVPIEMRVYKHNQAPTQFLIHIVDGYVSELEIFNADSSEINRGNLLVGEKIEILFEDKVLWAG